MGPLLIAWILDRIFADPESLPHPVVAFGKMISAFEKRMNNEPDRVFKGAVAALTLVLGVFIATWVLMQVISPFPALKFVVETVLVFYCLAGTTLSREVKDVFIAFSRGIEAARKQVARIVGRDTSSLSENEIKTAALETLAENLSDGVVAPMFWYMLLGVPGMLAYKMVNTLDSMIGYRNERYEEFGRFAARLDDVANYIPARLTALLIATASGCGRAFRFIRRFGRCHASPNSGYPESALAGVLDCRFGGTHSYFGKDFYKPYIGENPRALNDGDLYRSLKVCFLAELMMLLLVSAARILL